MELVIDYTGNVHGNTLMERIELIIGEKKEVLERKQGMWNKFFHLRKLKRGKGRGGNFCCI